MITEDRARPGEERKVFNVGPGSVINLTSFTHYTPNTQIGFKPPKGMVAVFMLLGNADKKNPDSFDCEQALRRIGWAPMHEVPNRQGELQEQRDELVEVLTQCRSALNTAYHDVADEVGRQVIARRIEAASAIIAKAKGGAV